ncbi:MAG: ABC transporter, partial [Burkholderiales bacterium PBB4]
MTNPELHPPQDAPVLHALGISLPGPNAQSAVHLPALAIPPGITWLGGGEGRGKTTLLRILAGALPSPHSSLRLGHCTLQEHPAAYRAQVVWLDPQSTVFEHTTIVDFFATIAAQYALWDSRLHQGLITALGLEAHLHKPLYMLSTGTKRKVWLGAALAS